MLHITSDKCERMNEMFIRNNRAGKKSRNGTAKLDVDTNTSQSTHLLLASK